MLSRMAADPTSAPELPDLLTALVDDYRLAHGAEVRLWVRRDAQWVIALDAGSGEQARGEERANSGAAPIAPGTAAVLIPGSSPEMRVEVLAPGAVQVPGAAAFLADVVSRLLRQDREARSIGAEIAERYEEITLLYTISEILGSVISLEQAAGNILTEVVDTLGVQRATLWVHDAGTGVLEAVASVGGEGKRGPIPVDDDSSVTAAVFRSRRSVILEPGDEFPRGENPDRVPTRGSFLSVPVSYTPPEGSARTIGVINLVGSHADQGFSAGDQKLISAIASQIGAAVENSRLVAASVRQERMVREMELAHDLQLKLLPSVEQFKEYAQVAARCIPADSVGGDFYQLFRLPGGRMGVMIGDVSSHGFGAALIMALTMSAAAIHASEGDSPGEVLRRTHHGLIGELENTEMYLTLFYGVIDPQKGEITYSNAGHHHAFRVSADSGIERLGATNPPFGIVDLDAYGERTAPWTAGEDLLCLFTDGLPDALGMGEAAGEQLILDQLSDISGVHPSDLLDRLFAVTAQTPIAPADDRTALLLRI
jgi:sigma-B regulation protein RsbU (phosphoserine phosphatase)